MKTFTGKMLLISIGLMAVLSGNAQTVITGGNVSGKWTKANSPYYVNDYITVAKGTVLEIEAGVTVAFADGTSLTINGQLLAEGTEKENIVFTRRSNNWGGLTFSAVGENESMLKYASIQYARYIGIQINGGSISLSDNVISNNNTSNNSSSGGVIIENGTVTLNNNVISNNNRYEVYISGGTVSLNKNVILNNSFYATKGIFSLTNNTIDILQLSNVELKAFQNNIFTKTVSISNTKLSGSIDNHTLNSISLSNNTGELEISNNTISGSSGRGLSISKSTVNIVGNNILNNNGGVSITNSSVVMMKNNTIKNNVFSSSSGGGIYMEGSTVDMYNNIISGNSATQAGGGIYVKDMIANIQNNVITNNKHAASKSGNGGGISLYNSNSMIINNSIVYNDAENGGGMYCSNGSSPVVINNIIYGNTSSLESQVYINDNNSAPKMLYNLNQCDCWGFTSGVNYNWEANYDDSNFDANPRFVNYALQNYRLQSTSPCINAGIDDVTGLNLPKTDIDGNARIFGGRIDIGAYEYGAPHLGIEPVVVQNQLVIYPNPSRDGIFQITTDTNELNWVVYDIKGKQISRGNLPVVDLSSCQKGIYMLQLQKGKEFVCAKLVKM